MDAILITGPTASGKSALAVSLAKKFGGEVINADSMQVYDTLHVVTARPDEADMEGVPHHLYGAVPAGASFSAGDWLRGVRPLLDGLMTRGKIPVFVGGTGLYFQALTGGLSEMPAIPGHVRNYWRERLAREGAPALHAALLLRDPSVAERLEPNDGHRLVRALEVLEATGSSISRFQALPGEQLVNPDRACKIILEPERALLHARINQRFARMLEGGATEEVRALLALGLPAEASVMKAIGVPQIAALIDGRLSHNEAAMQGAAATRQYAKRQMTWFRNRMDESWQRAGSAEEVLPV